MDKGVLTFNVEAFAAAPGDCFCTFRGQSYTMYGMYLLPQEVGIGTFQPYRRYTLFILRAATIAMKLKLG